MVSFFLFKGELECNEIQFSSHVFNKYLDLELSYDQEKEVFFQAMYFMVLLRSRLYFKMLVLRNIDHALRADTINVI